MKDLICWDEMKARYLAAVDEEPELPGDMPDKMWDAIHNDRDAAFQALRIAVRQTKSGIRQRILRLSSNAQAQPTLRSSVRLERLVGRDGGDEK